MSDDATLHRPIGVFDSGLGGLTVVRALRALLPAEQIVYLGDSARVPYGTRSAETVIRYARACARHLDQQGLKMLVVACNTVSAVSLPALREDVDIPVLGVITAGARAAVAATRGGAVGVIGTTGTIASRAYDLALANLAPGLRVESRAAPLLVPLAEEGWIAGPLPELAARHYLAPLVDAGVDVLLLGCTHYPLLAGALQNTLDALGSPARIVDSATAMAEDVARHLADLGLGRPGGTGGLVCHVTDRPASFQEVASRFLGAPIGPVEVVDI